MMPNINHASLNKTGGGVSKTVYRTPWSPDSAMFWGVSCKRAEAVKPA